MFEFEERHPSEKGFAAIWNTDIAPLLAPYAKKYTPRMRLALWGSIGVAVISAMGIYYAWTSFELATEDYRAAFYLAAIFGPLTALCIVNWPLYTLAGSFAKTSRAAVKRHFGGLFHDIEDPEPARALAHALKTEGFSDEDGPLNFARIDITNHAEGNYRDCGFRFFNVDYRTLKRDGRGRPREHSDHYFVMQVDVPQAFSEKIIIRRDYGRFVNWLRGFFNQQKTVHFDHPAFEKKYEVYIDGEKDALEASMATARKLITPAFCDNLLAIDKLFGSGMFGFAGSQALFENGKFTLMIDDIVDITDPGIGEMAAPEKVHEACRKMIARLAMVPLTIDYLHGDR